MSSMHYSYMLLHYISSLLYMPSLIMQELRQAIAKIPNEQEEEIRALMEGYEKEFERWSFQLL